VITQKVRKIGNTFSVTIPREEMERQQIKEGDTVTVEVRRVEIETQVRPLLSPIFADAYAEGLDRLDADMRYLADR
jgi:antitoxin component of MazEF toxin-antitoxin module